MKVIFDTNFLVSATQWNYSVAHKVLTKLIADESVKIYITQSILDELKEILIRDFKLTEDYIDNNITGLMNYIALIEPDIKIELVKEDPDDDKIIECAICASADYIVTYDKHLLNLKGYRGIQIVTPEELLKKLV